jgi:tRNA-2-methylthio-N6-dimethylallyladenosine synthase
MNDSAPRVCIITFGCQMNKLDSQILSGELRRAGFALTDDPGRADIVLYNTCSVRDHAENRVLSHVGSFRRRAHGRPGFVLGVIGCMAQRLGEDLVRQFGYLRLVAGTRALLRVPGHLQRIMAGDFPIVDIEEDAPLEFDRSTEMRVAPHQAFVSIMRGCDNFCSYCIVPYVRGREVSRSPQAILDEVEGLVAEGVVEVTLLGQNVNSYHHQERGRSTGLPELLGRINEVRRLERIRFVTCHPRDVSDEALQAMADLDKVCEHLHAPAQSGSDSVLERMNRGYTQAGYRAMVERARRTVPGIALCSDFIVGFPGETDRDFEDTLRLVRDVGFHQSFIFKYSPRPGTRAAQIPDDVPDAVKRERNQALLAAQEEADTARRAAMVGEVVQVLVNERSRGDDSRLSGRTRQNDIVVFEGADDLIGALCDVRITDSTALTLFGQRVQETPAG